MPINNSSQEARSLGDSLDALAQQLNATAEAIRSCTTSLDDLDDEILEDSSEENSGGIEGDIEMSSSITYQNIENLNNEVGPSTNQ